MPQHTIVTKKKPPRQIAWRYPITTHIVYDKRHTPSEPHAVTRIPPIELPGVSKPVTWAEPFRNVEDVVFIFIT